MRKHIKNHCPYNGEHNKTKSAYDEGIMGHPYCVYRIQYYLIPLVMIPPILTSIQRKQVRDPSSENSDELFENSNQASFKKSFGDPVVHGRWRNKHDVRVLPVGT